MIGNGGAVRSQQSQRQAVAVTAVDLERSEHAGHVSFGPPQGTGLLPTPTTQELAVIRDKAKAPGYEAVIRGANAVPLGPSWEEQEAN
ncbi:unnamed protein product [Linum trigynum]|uniref:Uncharacterized protein n=1 Tax=Linum trigynum TaxID=586398 RepID=A0AAV2EVF9_9ROSI